MAYLMVCLWGSARSWATVVWEQQSPLVSSYSNFTSEMRKIFDHPIHRRDAAKKQFVNVLALPQSLPSGLAAESGWNKEALRGAFQNVINENIKDELVSYPEPEGLDNL